MGGGPQLFQSLITAELKGAYGTTDEDFVVLTGACIPVWCGTCGMGHVGLERSHAGGGGGVGTRPRLGGGGGDRAIYRNLPQLYRNFSVMPLFKNFNFQMRKNISLPSLSLGTLYVHVFSSVLHVICVAGRFSVFVFPKCRLLLGTVILARAKGQ